MRLSYAPRSYDLSYLIRFRLRESPSGPKSRCRPPNYMISQEASSLYSNLLLLYREPLKEKNRQPNKKSTIKQTKDKDKNKTQKQNFQLKNDTKNENRNQNKNKTKPKLYNQPSSRLRPPMPPRYQI